MMERVRVQPDYCLYERPVKREVEWNCFSLAGNSVSKRINIIPRRNGVFFVLFFFKAFLLHNNFFYLKHFYLSPVFTSCLQSLLQPLPCLNLRIWYIVKEKDNKNEAKYLRFDTLQRQPLSAVLLSCIKSRYMLIFTPYRFSVLHLYEILHEIFFPLLSFFHCYCLPIHPSTSISILELRSIPNDFQLHWKFLGTWRHTSLVELV